MENESLRDLLGFDMTFPFMVQSALSSEGLEADATLSEEQLDESWGNIEADLLAELGPEKLEVAKEYIIAHGTAAVKEMARLIYGEA